MKVLLTIFFTISFLTTAVIAQQASGNLTTKSLQENNAEVVRLFQKKEYKEALPLAERSVEMARKLFGEKHIETAAALRNVGYLQYLKGDPEKAEDTLKDAFGIYEKLPDPGRENGVLVAKMLELIALIRYQKKLTDGEEYYQLALDWREKYNGRDSPETLAALSALANINYWGGNYEKAAELFRRVLEISAKDPDLDKADTQLVFYRCECAYRKSGKIDEFESVKEKYRFDSKSVIGVKRVADLPLTNETDDRKTVSGGVINGKALNLPSPGYPVEARRAGARGAVYVQVLINEEGDIISACTVNDANRYLAEASERAAYQAKFRPTELEGKPVKVLGIITYVFN